MPVDVTCPSCAAHLRVPRKLITAGEPIACLKCGVPMDVIQIAAQVAAGTQVRPAPRNDAGVPVSAAPCEFCEVRLDRFQFLKQAVKVCPRCGKRLAADEPEPPPVASATEPAAAPRMPRAVPVPFSVPQPESDPEFAELPDAAAQPSAALRLPGLNLCGASACLLAGLALVFASFWWLHYLTIPLAMTGLLLAPIGLLAQEKKGVSEWLWTGIGEAGNLAVLGVALFWPQTFGLAWYRGARTPTIALDQPVLMSPGAKRITPLDASSWVEAGQGAIRHGEVQVRLKAARIDVPPADKRAAAATPSLVVELRVSNVGLTRMVDYAGWRDDAPSLRDVAGRSYRFLSAGAGTPATTDQGRARQLAPGLYVDEVLRFEPPQATVAALFVELPGAALHLKEPLKFKIDRSQIESLDKLK